ncbi:Dps family protein [Bacillaceae bacterium]
MSAQLAQNFNKLLADLNVMYVKLHHYHWFVKGEHFFELHAKFEEFYTEIATYIDRIAERLLAIKGKPVATMKEYLQLASLAEASGDETPLQMVKNVAADFEKLIAELKEGAALAERENDGVTADLLTEIRGSLEKHVWMLQAFLTE